MIIGYRTVAKHLATLFYICGGCHQMAGQRLFERATWFTFFFIPLFPLSKSRSIVCAFCGGQTQVSKETAERFLVDALAASIEPSVAAEASLPQEGNNTTA